MSMEGIEVLQLWCRVWDSEELVGCEFVVQWCVPMLERGYFDSRYCLVNLN